MEVDRKYVEGSTVQIEYNLLITNEGNLEGYVNDIVDLLPNDLEFNTNVNNNWYMSSDGKLHNTSLNNKLIKPGETISIPLILTKTLTNNNLGYTINTAEIAKQSNDLGATDIDSLPGNNNDTEDDYSKAEVILSVKTGTTILIISIIITIITILTIAGLIIVFLRKRGENIND